MSKSHLALLRCPLALFSSVVYVLMCYHASIFVMDEWEYALQEVEGVPYFRCVHNSEKEPLTTEEFWDVVKNMEEFEK